MFSSPAGTGTTGLDVTTNGGVSLISVGDQDGFTINKFTFIAPNNVVIGNGSDIGMFFNLGANSNVQIFDNLMTMTGPSLEAIQFATVAGPSNAVINNNLINLTDLNGFGNVFGIRILAVTSGLMGLSGTSDNVITINGQTNSGFPYFFAPPTGTVGQIVVNGVLVP